MAYEDDEGRPAASRQNPARVSDGPLTTRRMT